MISGVKDRGTQPVARSEAARWLRPVRGVSGVLAEGIHLSSVPGSIQLMLGLDTTPYSRCVSGCFRALLGLEMGSQITRGDWISEANILVAKLLYYSVYACLILTLVECRPS
ncbi:hypothetical protein CEXT_150811 [Caerostris extrusa]|uniref:Uncharacterized protein n=1 Tax=Caerostris extrusa TaxID=172846 RepID=A0AAV4P7A8_CAEEX|nr:hypothetical protein CEXT_150811 [Caerostris extrusa]